MELLHLPTFYNVVNLVFIEFGAITPYVVDTLKNPCFMRYNVFNIPSLYGASCVKLRRI